MTEGKPNYMNTITKKNNLNSNKMQPLSKPLMDVNVHTNRTKGLIDQATNNSRRNVLGLFLNPSTHLNNTAKILQQKRKWQESQEYFRNAHQQPDVLRLVHWTNSPHWVPVHFSHSVKAFLAVYDTQR